MLKVVIGRKGRGDKKGTTTSCYTQGEGKSYSHTVHGITPRKLNDIHIALESFIAGLPEEIEKIKKVRDEADEEEFNEIVDFTEGQLKVMEHILKLIKWDK